MHPTSDFTETVVFLLLGARHQLVRLVQLRVSLSRSQSVAKFPASQTSVTHTVLTNLTDETKKVIEHGSYVRIWRKVDGRWQIVLDITNAH